MFVCCFFIVSSLLSTIDIYPIESWDSYIVTSHYIFITLPSIYYFCCVRLKIFSNDCCNTTFILFPVLGKTKYSGIFTFKFPFRAESFIVMMSGLSLFTISQRLSFLDVQPSILVCINLISTVLFLFFCFPLLLGLYCLALIQT